MINRVIKKLKFLSLQSGIGTFNEFKKIKPFNQLDINTIELNKKKLNSTYQQYINEISRPDMAASLELATLLYTICKLNHYTKLLDMGSGFSSFVFRLYAKETPDVQVFSVDDDEAWIEKTKDFVRQHELDTQNIISLKQFLKLNESGFDCVLHDLNFVEIRVNYVEQIILMGKKGGIIILDDVHKIDYLTDVLRILKKTKTEAYTLKPVTLDNFNRYALAVLKD